MQRFLVTLVVLFICSACSTAQSLTTIFKTADFIEVDKQKNIYLVDGVEVSKYSPVGEFLYSYSNKMNGVITTLDVSNPLRLLVFWEGSNRVAFLNQQLAPISEPVNLYTIANMEISNAGASSNGGFWAYNLEFQSLNHITSQWVKNIEY